MKSIQSNIQNEWIEKKSRFICLIYQVENKSEIDAYLKNVKSLYPNATHYCYAYILENNIRCSDNGEPTGSAGKPILNVLTSNHLDHVLAIVVRYFGGIKLGTGGLVRAYTKSVTMTLAKGTIIPLEKYKTITLTFSYAQEKKINHLLHLLPILNRIYQEEITYKIGCPQNQVEKLLEVLKKENARIEEGENFIIQKRSHND